MIGSLIRALAIAGLGAIGGAACVAAAFALDPTFSLEMDVDLPRNVSGIYPPEFVPGGDSFAWTGRSAKVSLQGLDRRVPWTCTVRFRGGRSAPLPQPTVVVAVDGLASASRVATNTFEDLDVPVTTAARGGLSLTIAASTPFVPGPGDPRELGVQLDRLQCRPAAGAIALPPRRAYLGGMVAGALFGAAFGAIGITAGSAVAAVLLLVLAQAFPLASGAAPYTAYVNRVPWLALWISGAMVLAVTALEWPRRPALRQTARFAIAFSAAVLYLKLLGLLHPEKPLVDAVFQAHRLQWVLDGRYYFTQLMPSGVQFPYAVGLYVFAAPWSAITRDHVSLLRIVVCTVECLAGVALYPMIVHAWKDRLAGGLAVALFAVVPTSYWVVGNANLTNAFGQSVATLSVALIVLWSLGSVRPRHILMWTSVVALALLSHVSTFATLGLTLMVIAVLFWWSAMPGLRAAARGVLIATSLAMVFSVAVYYGHFGEVYANALKVRAGSIATSTTTPAASPRQEQATPRRPTDTPAGAGTRLVRSVSVVASAVGLPILALALGGIWLVSRRRSRDPLTLALVAWGVAFVLFFGVALIPVETQFQRYSLEFVQRVAYAASPACVVLAAMAAAAGWRWGRLTRLASVAVLAMAMAIGFREWSAWW